MGQDLLMMLVLVVVSSCHRVIVPMMMAISAKRIYLPLKVCSRTRSVIRAYHIMVRYLLTLKSKLNMEEQSVNILSSMIELQYVVTNCSASIVPRVVRTV